MAPRAHCHTRPPPHAPDAPPAPPPPSSSGPAETTTDAHKRQGDALLRKLITSEGHEDFDAWATRVGTGCEWARPGGLHHEFARICGVWQSRGYISAPDKTIAPNELRAVKAGWKIVFSRIVGELMPDGWCDKIPIFKEMSDEAERQARKRKINAGRTLTRRAECELQLSDALQIAEECLARAEQSVGGQAMLKSLHAHQQIVWALQGKRGMLLARQHTSDAIVKPFGAGEEFGPRLFRCELQPECLVLERELKGEAAQQTMELLGVIPCRKTILCPVAALAMLRLYQFGRSFQGGLPPDNIVPHGDGDWPFFESHLGDFSKFRSRKSGVCTDALVEAATSLGFDATGGVLSSIRNLSTAMLSGNPDVSEADANIVNDHSGRKRQKADTNYNKIESGATLAQAMYGTNDPQMSAALKALVHARTHMREQLTEMTLLLVTDGFRARYMADEQSSTIKRFFKTTLYLIGSFIVLSRARPYDKQDLLDARGASLYERYAFVQKMLEPIASHPCFVEIGAILRRYEDTEIDLGSRAQQTASSLFAAVDVTRTVSNVMAAQLESQTAEIAKMHEKERFTSQEVRDLKEEWDAHEPVDRVDELLEEMRFSMALARLSRLKPASRRAAALLRAVATPWSVWLASDGEVSLLRDSRYQDGSEARWRAHESAYHGTEALLHLEEEDEGTLGPAAVAASRRRRVFDLTSLPRRPRPSLPSPPPLPPPSLPLSAPTSSSIPSSSSSALVIAAPAPAATSAASATADAATIAAKVLTLDGKLAPIIGRFVHHGLQLEHDDAWPSDYKKGGAKKTRQKVRDLVAAALCKTLAPVEPSECDPAFRPDRLLYALHDCEPKNKQTWTAAIQAEDTVRFDAARAFILVPTNLAALQAGLCEHGLTAPDPALLPPPPPPLSAPPRIDLRGDNVAPDFYIAMDPSTAGFGFAKFHVRDSCIERVEYFSVKLRGSDIAAKLVHLTRVVAAVLEGARECFIEPYFAPDRQSGAPVNHYVRAVALQQCGLAHVPYQWCEMKRWMQDKANGGLGVTLTGDEKHEAFRVAISGRLNGAASSLLDNDETAAVGIGLRKLHEKQISAAAGGNAVPLLRVSPPVSEK